MEGVDLIIDPDSRDARRAGARHHSEQLAASIAISLAEGFAISLARQLAKFTITPGPWLLFPDGKVTAPHGDAAREAALVTALAEVAELLNGEICTADDEDWKRVASAAVERAWRLLP